MGEVEHSPEQHDYAAVATIDVDTTAGLVDAFRAHRGLPVRLLGSGSAQSRLPAPDREPTLLRLRGLRGIERLEPDDLTCTVAPGTPRAELDHALADADLWLPCAGTGTLGGIFASDLHAPCAPGGFSARSLLLGLDGVLADGTRFKSGARVVKSVAGFDLQKLFVGSRGRLFAATRLHLKLRPRPRSMRPFCRAALDEGTAVALFRSLRAERDACIELWLERTGDAFTVRGRTAGHPEHLSDVHRRHELGDDHGDTEPPAERLADHEIVSGQIRPSRLAALLGALPTDTGLRINGTGQFEAVLTPNQTDALIAAAPDVPAAIEVRAGPADRRGHGTSPSESITRLEHAVRAALDPEGMLR